MRAEILPDHDTTTLFLRWEIIPEAGELKRLESLGGPLVMVIPANDYVDVSGAYHETFDVEVPIYPHRGRRNFGQAKFTAHESRRAFLEALQGGVVSDVANFVWDAEPGSVPIEGHRIRIEAGAEA